MPIRVIRVICENPRFWQSRKIEIDKPAWTWYDLTSEEICIVENSVWTQETELNRILEIIGRIAETTTDGDFIYRGEPQHYEKVSSSLWRECQKEIGTEEFDIEAIQARMLELAKGYTHEEDNFEILTELQHYGGHTNLILSSVSKPPCFSWGM